MQSNPTCAGSVSASLSQHQPCHLYTKCATSSDHDLMGKPMQCMVQTAAVARMQETPSLFFHAESLARDHPYPPFPFE